MVSPVAGMTAVRCADGRQHQFVYLGMSEQRYRCSLCGGMVRKYDLKRQTESQLIPTQPKEEAIPDAQ